MIGKSDVFTRRILTFPAVRPCEAISPATLLHSLIILASNIHRYRSSFFVTNNRNARESIRLIGILSIFFEEIQESQTNLSDSAVLSLSEIHFIFQKLQFLLEDCNRDGARLWLLMKCENVASQFRELMRAVAAALDVLPLDSLDVSVDAKESIQLAMKQARKFRFEVSKIDKLASKDVFSILNQFENHIVPKSSDLRRVLNRLGIRNWTECHKEIKFLDSEMGSEWLSAGKRDLALLSSLIGFMSYCRGVSFAAVDGVATRHSNCRSTAEVVVSLLNSDDFRCPISLEIMSDPVTIPTGHTYDRSSILKWFEAGNPTCPKTGEKLTSTNLVPNLALKRLILLYCDENGVPVTSEKGGRNRNVKRCTVLARSEAAEGAMKMLAEFLAGILSAGDGEESKNKATLEIRFLTKTSVFSRSCLAESGTIPHLLNLLSSSANPLTQENAMASLLNLSKHSKSKRIIVENGGVKPILKVLKNRLKIEARQHAAGALFYLASTEEYRILIGKTQGAIPALVDLLREGTDKCKRNALVAIFGLLMHPNNHRRAISAGLVPLLGNLLTSTQREDLITDSLAVLATIAKTEEGSIAILTARAVVPVIIEILNISTTSMAGKEFCVSLLLALCINGGEDVLHLLSKSLVSMGPLYSHLTDGSFRGRKKASSLIRILHEFHERSSSDLMTAAFPGDRFVHVW
ncbi:hypothetical protein U1Q18_017050 [Sarracenia purpurea var. burkii]